METKPATFATCLSCMDGRVILPSTQYIRDRHQVEFVDIITEAGMDGFLARSGPLDGILRKIDISFQKHGSTVAYIVGHSDCSGNSVDDKRHKSDILMAIDRIKTFRSITAIGGLFIGRDWKPVAIGTLPTLSTPAKLVVVDQIVSPPPSFPALAKLIPRPSNTGKAPAKTLMMVCSRCKAENSPHSLVCDKCGKSFL